MKIFISYCREDKSFLDILLKHLTPTLDKHKAVVFTDHLVRPGGDVNQHILDNLNDANIVLLLMSSGFLASYECQKEMQLALQRKEQDQIDIVPIIIRPCDWENTVVKKYKALPTNGKPISKWKDRNEACLDAARGIDNLIMDKAIAEPNAEFTDALKITGFKSNVRDDVSLDDIFIVPNITESTEKANIPISNLSELSYNPGIALLYGDDLSGKSTICKKLYLDRIKAGQLTLLLDGGDIKKYQNRFEIIKKAFFKQYEGSENSWHRHNNRLIIIDNFDVESCAHVVHKYEEHCESVLLTMSRNKYIAYCRSKKFLANARLFDLGHLTHSQQEMLIRRWKTSNQQDGYKPTVHDGAIDRVEGILNSLIPNRRIVPRFPFYVLTVLQSLEAFGPENLKITTFGHCYYAFLVFQLRAAGVSGAELDSIMNFLSFVAFERFQAIKRNQRKLNIDEVISKYRRNFVGTDLRIRRFISNATNILIVGSDQINFQHRYIYYFLLGYYFARNREDFQIFSADMIANCHTQDNSFALIFTIHHSSDIELIESLIKHANGLFQGSEISTLETDETIRLESALQKIPKNILSRSSVEEVRKKHRERRDRLEEQIDGEEDIDGGKIYMALKSTEILAQIVLNKSGSLRKEKCVELIQVICDLAFKIVNLFISKKMILALDQFVLSQVAEASKEGISSSSVIERELSRRLKAIITYLVYLVVRKASISIGQVELVEIVQGICKERDTTAYWLMFWIYRLNSAEQLNDEIAQILVRAIQECARDKNEVVKRLISLEVQFYLNSHRVDFNLRQKICESLEIEYIPNRPL